MGNSLGRTSNNDVSVAQQKSRKTEKAAKAAAKAVAKAAKAVAKAEKSTIKFLQSEMGENKILGYLKDFVAKEADVNKLSQIILDFRSILVISDSDTKRQFLGLLENKNINLHLVLHDMETISDWCSKNDVIIQSEDSRIIYEMELKDQLYQEVLIYLLYGHLKMDAEANIVGIEQKKELEGPAGNSASNPEPSSAVTIFETPADNSASNPGPSSVNKIFERPAASNPRPSLVGTIDKILGEDYCSEKIVGLGEITILHGNLSSDSDSKTSDERCETSS